MGVIENNLPDNAHLAFKGKVFEVWQWEQKMPDGSVKIFERLRRPDTLIIFAVVGDRIVMQKQQQATREEAYFSLPGGAGEWNERALDAAKRELVEETGYISSDWELLRIQKPFSKIIWTIYTYIARDCRYTKPRPEKDEHIETTLVSFDELLQYADNPLFQDNAVIDYLLRAKFDPLHREIFRRFLWNVGA